MYYDHESRNVILFVFVLVPGETEEEETDYLCSRWASIIIISACSTIIFFFAVFTRDFRICTQVPGISSLRGPAFTRTHQILINIIIIVILSGERGNALAATVKYSKFQSVSINYNRKKSVLLIFLVSHYSLADFSPNFN